MNKFDEFIDKNRQHGSTTALVRAALGVDGYVVVHSEQMKQHLLGVFESLNPARVLTLKQIKDGMYPNESRPVFFDACCMCALPKYVNRECK